MKAANAYMGLVIDAPEHARRFNRIDDMIATGQRINDALSRITLLPDGNGGTQANTDLFAALFQKYREVLNNFDALVRAEEQEYIETQMLLPNPAPNVFDYLDPWKSAAEQVTSYRPEFSTINSTQGQQLAAPTGLPQRVPNLYAIAKQLSSQDPSTWGNIGFDAVVTDARWMHPLSAPDNTGRLVLEAEDAWLGPGVADAGDVALFTTAAPITHLQLLSRVVIRSPSGRTVRKADRSFHEWPLRWTAVLLARRFTFLH
jgi:hypothetical protein